MKEDEKPLSDKGQQTSVSQPGKWVIRSKIWVEDEKGRVLFGSGRLRILESVVRHGSILGAAKEFHMSYRAVWGKIKATEKRLGQPLLTRRVGGARGGGSELTPLGKALLERFQRLQALTEDAADTLFEDFVAEFIEGEKIS